MGSQKRYRNLYRAAIWIPSFCYVLVTFAFVILPRSIFDSEYAASAVIFSRKLPFNFDWDFGSLFHYGNSLAAKFVLFKLSLLVVFVSANFLVLLTLWLTIRPLSDGFLRYGAEDYKLIYFLFAALVFTFCINFIIPEWTQVVRHGNESIFILSLCLCVLAHLSLVTLFIVLITGARQFRNLFVTRKDL